MKQNNTFIVLRDKEGNYLAGFENNPQVLAYSADWVSAINEALTIPEKYFYGEDNEQYLAMTKMFDAELIKVQAEYTLTTLDGQEPAEPVKDADDTVGTFFEKMLSDILGED
ncbi:hypothetical protein ACTGYU_00620 [Streptococcus suis]|uniref:hypothetical protein n=1 Tax=Streptococcus suis TaxID=1307 RepID=UPI0015544C96|nr:hypothetical protein [Streptococcus suis]MBY5023907.1 hypothetical protein [Streptococcus suis]MDW8667621.1 hypothetical protein [Streptococcus suis]NQQ29114.1 hypothetical protein [Streptococcus suis]HEM5552990.1 hypothetical protein [Streptococcus suis]